MIFSRYGLEPGVIALVSALSAAPADEEGGEAKPGPRKAEAAEVAPKVEVPPSAVPPGAGESVLGSDIPSPRDAEAEESAAPGSELAVPADEEGRTAAAAAEQPAAAGAAEESAPAGAVPVQASTDAAAGVPASEISAEDGPPGKRLRVSEELGSA